MDHRQLITVGMPVAAALLVAACGSSSNNSATGAKSGAAGTTTTANAGAIVAVAAIPTHGQDLVNSSGRTLYRFDPESDGMIACTGTCTQTWMPLAASGTGTPTAGSGVTETLSTIKRPDGTTQVTAAGWPLYTYAGDSAAGDANGDGAGGKWHIVPATGVTAANTASPSGAQTTTSPPTTAHTSSTSGGGYGGAYP
jgi:predicted lipoprotein with Yx(FWY)xxD motif